MILMSSVYLIVRLSGFGQVNIKIHQNIILCAAYTDVKFLRSSSTTKTESVLGTKCCTNSKERQYNWEY